MGRFEFGQKLFFVEDGEVITGLYCGTGEYSREIVVRIADDAIDTKDYRNAYLSEAEALKANTEEEIEKLTKYIKSKEEYIKEYQEELAEYQAKLLKLKAG